MSSPSPTLIDTRASLKLMVQFCHAHNCFEDSYYFLFKLLEEVNEEDLEEIQYIEARLKEALNSKRNALRQIILVEKKEKAANNPNCHLLIDLKNKISDEIIKMSEQIISQLTKVRSKENSKVHIALLKMKSDFLRYCCESISETDPKKEVYTQNAKESYEKLFKLAEQHLAIYEPLRLAVILNYSVFCYSAYGNVLKAVEIASEAQKQVIQLLSVDESLITMAVKEILTSLDDNLTLWKYELPDEEREDTVLEDEELEFTNYFVESKNIKSFPK